MSYFLVSESAAVANVIPIRNLKEKKGYSSQQTTIHHRRKSGKELSVEMMKDD